MLTWNGSSIESCSFTLCGMKVMPITDALRDGLGPELHAHFPALTALAIATREAVADEAGDALPEL